jgi:hypothetical protein
LAENISSLKELLLFLIFLVWILFWWSGRGAVRGAARPRRGAAAAAAAPEPGIPKSHRTADLVNGTLTNTL